MEFTIKTIMKASPDNIYNAWLDSEKHSLMTGGEAKISAAIGENFKAWDGYIEGQNLTLEPNIRIKQSWRTIEFQDDEVDSIVEITLRKIEGGTEITLVHTMLPEHGKQYLKGWDENYFQPMKIYFENL